MTDQAEVSLTSPHHPTTIATDRANDALRAAIQRRRPKAEIDRLRTVADEADAAWWAARGKAVPEEPVDPLSLPLHELRALGLVASLTEGFLPAGDDNGIEAAADLFTAGMILGDILDDRDLLEGHARTLRQQGEVEVAEALERVLALVSMAGTTREAPPVSGEVARMDHAVAARG